MQETSTIYSLHKLPPYIQKPQNITLRSYLGHTIYKNFTCDNTLNFLTKSIVTFGIYTIYKLSTKLYKYYHKDPNQLNYLEKMEAGSVGRIHGITTIGNDDSLQTTFISHPTGGRIGLDERGLYVQMPKKPHEFYFNCIKNEVDSKIEKMPYDSSRILLIDKDELNQLGKKISQTIKSLQGHILSFEFPTTEARSTHHKLLRNCYYVTLNLENFRTLCGLPPESHNELVFRYFIGSSEIKN